MFPRFPSNIILHRYLCSLFTFFISYIIAAVMPHAYARYFVLSLYLKFKVNCESISTPSATDIELREREWGRERERSRHECANWCSSEVNKKENLMKITDFTFWLTATYVQYFFFRFFLHLKKPQKCYRFPSFFFFIIGRLLWQYSQCLGSIAGACRKSDRVSYSKLNNYMICNDDALYPL